ncbi:activating signal cointegrator 1 isoform X2 [Planococcus citri]|uniref:activating signal cointegrator 1 isoform X2 n=1 Tax=Planococcus citri TaxID=170843 RepID=UPI0031F9FF82
MSDQKLILKEWVKDKLSDILDFQVDDETAKELIAFQQDRDLETHLKGFLNYKDPKSRRFITEFIKRRQTINNELVQKKRNDDDDDKYTLKNNKNVIKSDASINFDVPAKKANPPVEKSPKSNTDTASTIPKKKNKFVNFYAKDGETVLLKGRYLCNCEAKKHALINNCMKCGRIVCQQEGSGPCFVCETLVCTNEELLVFNGDTDKASKLYEQLLTQEKPKVQMQKGLQEAINQRNKLLEFDRNTEKHTHVFDDDSDYYCSVNPWLTLDQRDEIKKKEEEFFKKKNQSRMEKKITINIEGGKIVEVEEKENSNRITEKDIKSIAESKSIAPKNAKLNSVNHLLDPYFTSFKPKFKGRVKHQKISRSLDLIDYNSGHILDYGLRQMTDEGFCLSVHQPWAQFLVHGIRKGEGRTWYTSYRGKLWIASTGIKVSRQDAIKQENTYRNIVGDIKFPADYPSSALIGSVNLVDCLTQEQYRIEYPQGELEDPYVFVFENPQPLPIRYPIKGKPNIYKLDEKVHMAAKNCLKTMEKVISESTNKVGENFCCE